MGFLQSIKNLQSKSEEYKRKFALNLAVAITAVIFIIWAVTLYLNFKK